MLQQREAHHQIRHPLTTSSISNLLHVFDEPGDVEELRYWTHLTRFFVDHHCCADTTIRMAATRDLSPLSFWTMDQVCEVSKSSHQRQREPVASRFCNSNLVLHVMS